MRVIRHFIDGEFVSSASGRTFSDVNPATGETIAEVAEGGKAEIERAVEAARRAFDGAWGKLAVPARMELLVKLAAGIRARSDEFVRAEVEDTGKPITLASHLDIPRGSANFLQFAEHFKYAATECWEMDGALNYALRRPVGVVGVIAPWNLPLLLMTWKVAPALAAGNCVVVKPSEETPATAALLGEVANEVGLPPGVYNVVHGFGTDSAGSALSEHPDVDAITFTGETTTGRAIMKACSQTLKKLSFELGGKNPNVIFADAPLEEALETTIRSSFANQGEVCLAGSRILVERPLFETFVGRLVEKARTEVRIGDPLDPATTMGSLISRNHAARVKSYLEVARKDGGQFLCGGTTPAYLASGLDRETFLEPTVIAGLPATSRAQCEEIFGPVVTVTPFDDEDECIRVANDGPYGLSATLWTSDLRRAHRVSARLDAGIVWVNTWFLRDLRTPFGGVKDSGIGREGGVHSLEFYTELKNVCVKL